MKPLYFGTNEDNKSRKRKSASPVLAPEDTNGNRRFAEQSAVQSPPCTQMLHGGNEFTAISNESPHQYGHLIRVSQSYWLFHRALGWVKKKREREKGETRKKEEIGQRVWHGRIIHLHANATTWGWGGNSIRRVSRARIRSMIKWSGL